MTIKLSRQTSVSISVTPIVCSWTLSRFDMDMRVHSASIFLLNRVSLCFATCFWPQSQQKYHCVRGGHQKTTIHQLFSLSSQFPSGLHQWHHSSFPGDPLLNIQFLDGGHTIDQNQVPRAILRRIFLEGI